MTIRGTEVDAAVAALRGLAAEAFDVAGRIERTVQAALSNRADGLPTRADLAGVEPIARAAMTAPDSRIQGAGFVAAVGLLRTERWWLEWFVRDDDGRPDRLDVPTDPDAMGFHDYETIPWYAVPRDTGGRHVMGPYVDSLCTEDYTLTFTLPVLTEAGFAGVAGADIGVRAAERSLLPALRTSRRRLAVVNAEGRVLVSNTGAIVCGELLGGTHRDRTVDDLPLRVVALD